MYEKSNRYLKSTAKYDDGLNEHFFFALLHAMLFLCNTGRQAQVDWAQAGYNVPVSNQPVRHSPDRKLAFHTSTSGYSRKSGGVVYP